MTATGSSTESVEAAWVRLHRHLDRASGFWLGFVFAVDLHGVNTLAERAQWNRRRRMAPFARLTPTTPAELAHLVDELEARAPGPPGCTWVDAVHTGDDLGVGGSWTDAWTTFLQSLNHRRDTLRRSLGGLVIAGPPEAKLSALRVSTDLWSIRDFLTELEPTISGAVEVAQTIPPSTELERPASDSAPRGALALGGDRSPEQHDEVLTLLAASDDSLNAGWRSRLATAIDAAVARDDHPAASSLLLRRARARADEDPAGARDDATRAADLAPDDHTLLSALTSLFDMTMQAMALDEAEEIAKRSVAIAERLADRVATLDALRDLSLSLNNLGWVHEARGDWPAAETVYTRSLELTERLADQLATPQARRDLSLSLNNLGRVHEARGNWPAAEAVYSRALDLAERLADELATPEVLRDLSVSLNNLGRVHEARGDWPAAEAAYSRSLDLRQRLADQLGTPEALRDLSISLTHLGRVHRARGDWPAAEAVYTRSLDLAERLAEQLATPQARRDLAASLHNLGRVHRARGDWPAAEAIYTRSLDLTQRLAEQLATPQAVRDFSLSLDNLGRVHEARDDWPAAESVYTRSLDLAERLADQLPTPQAVRDLSVTLNNLGRVHEARDDWAAAEVVYTRSLDLAERLADQLATPEALRDLFISVNNLGRVHQARGEWPAAEAAYTRSLDLAKRLADQLATPEALRDLAVSLNNLGRVHLARGDQPGALVALQEAVRLLRRLVDLGVVSPGDETHLSEMLDVIDGMEQAASSRPAGFLARAGRVVKRFRHRNGVPPARGGASSG